MARQSLTSIQNGLLHLQFLVSPSAPGSKNQDGLSRLQMPPIFLDPYGPRSGRQQHPDPLLCCLPAYHTLPQDRFGSHGIDIFLHKELFWPIHYDPWSSDINRESQYQQNNGGLGWDEYLWSYPQYKVGLDPHHPCLGIVWGETLRRGPVAFYSLCREVLNQQTLNGEESRGGIAGRVKPRVGRASVATAASELLPAAVRRYISSSDFVKCFHRCFLSTWWLNKKSRYVLEGEMIDG